MQIYDLKFDAGQGEVEIDEAKGVASFKLTESNPSYPGGAQFNIPLDPLFEAIKAKVAAGGSLIDKLEAYGIGVLETAVDQST